MQLGGSISNKEGDVLIAGYMDGNYTDRRYVHSLGEVQAKVPYSECDKIYLNQENLIGAYFSTILFFSFNNIFFFCMISSCFSFNSYS